MAVVDLLAGDDRSLINSHNLFSNNPDADYYKDPEGNPYFTNGDFYYGATTIDAQFDPAENNLTGWPGFAPLIFSSLSQDPSFDSDTRTTTLQDTAALYVPDALKGRILLFGNDNGDMRLILSNTLSTITLMGEPGKGVAAGTVYAILDFNFGADSAAVDSGTDLYAPDHDLMGNPRPRDIAELGGNGTGKEFDIGAFEMQPPETRVHGGWLLYE